MRNSPGNGRNVNGGQGDAPLGMPPPLGERGSLSYSLVKTLLPSKKSDEFPHPDHIKNHIFFLSDLFKPTELKKTIAYLKVCADLIQARDAGKNSKNPCFSFKERIVRNI